MKKPHEEEWESADGHVLINWQVEVMTNDRARLAARAPRMARALLALRNCTPTHDWEQELYDVWEEAEHLLRAAGVLP
jgi:hypothetical protein